jgi:pilus assembly protein CpaC
MNTHFKLHNTIAVCILLLISAALISPVTAAPAEVTKVLTVGTTELIECKNLTRAAIGDPGVADFAVISSREILLNAKADGATCLYIWDASGRRLFNILVKSLEIDIEQAAQSIEKEIGNINISTRAVGTSILLEGLVDTQAESDRIYAIAQAVLANKATQSKPQQAASPAPPATQANAASSGQAKVVNLIQVKKPIEEISQRTIATAKAIREGLNRFPVNVRPLPGSVVLVEGMVGTQEELNKIEIILKGWGKTEKTAGSGADETITIVNSVEINSSIARQIMVRAELLDIDKKATRNLGVDWGTLDLTDIWKPVVLDQPFIIGQPVSGGVDILGGGAIQRINGLGARIKALEEENKARLLAKPNVLVLDGREASILVGGEIPVPIGQGNAGAISVQYKEYGVRLKVTPSITSPETMQLKVAVEVSSIDIANSVTISGFEIPALQTRRSEATLNVRNGQSLLIGGLLQKDISKVSSKIPLLGDIPILGQLFRSTKFINGETELVIMITPDLVKPTAEQTVAKTQPDTAKTK